MTREYCRLCGHELSVSAHDTVRWHGGGYEHKDWRFCMRVLRSRFEHMGETQAALRAEVEGIKKRRPPR